MVLETAFGKGSLLAVVHYRTITSRNFLLFLTTCAFYDSDIAASYARLCYVNLITLPVEYGLRSGALARYAPLGLDYPRLRPQR